MIINFILLMLIFAVSAKEVKAYLDPGSGSYFLQILFASFFSLMLFFKNFWKKLFQRGKDSKDEKSGE